MNASIVELYVKNPPSDFEQAFIVAKEQMAYCDDIVFQGTIAVERLAKIKLTVQHGIFGGISRAITEKSREWKKVK